MPLLALRMSQPFIVVDINRIADLAYLEQRDGYLAIGAMTREHALEVSPIVEKSYALLFDTAKVIADPLVRNKATVGGNLAHADPANDHPATMLAYNAQVIARSDIAHPVDQIPAQRWPRTALLRF